jgi:nicotinamide phosphoribosyltransferase
LVIRPDSGDPVEVVPEAIERLMKKFGYTLNTKGYKVLPACVRLIQGDGVCAASIEAILAEMKARGLSADNVAFGMGGELLQKVNRDTQKFAMKASAICVNGQWREVYKDPITDQGKRSKKGRLALVRVNGQFQTVSRDTIPAGANELVTVFRNGKLLVEYTLAEVREVALGAVDARAA